MSPRRMTVPLVALFSALLLSPVLGMNTTAQTQIHLYGQAPNIWSQSPSLGNPNPPLTINASTAYQFFLHSVDAPVPHTFLVDLNDNNRQDPGEPFHTNFVANNPPATLDVNIAAAGSYTYFCTIHPDMRGTLTVVGGGGGTLLGLPLLVVVGVAIAVVVVLALAAVFMMRRKGPPQ